ncbi:SIMPL domain-containing protein [Candidatus Parcubacteria bacterium]|nr:SIMPL domain-containing protein [Candidatus Parcubacteria bacterium]
MELFDGVWGERFRKSAFVVVILVAVFLAVEVVAGVQGLRYIGTGTTPTNTISVSGYGEALAVPDIATFTFSVVSEKSTVAAAQTDATTKANAITKYLKDAGIADKDIQTSNYSVYPQYDYQTAVCQANGVCPGGRSVLRGYEVRQTTTVKVRDTAKAGDLLTGVGTQGATEVSGLNFTFDDPQMVQDQAREKAITDAKDKANTLAKQLGVRLVRVVSFNENGNNPGPIPYYSKAMDATAQGMGGAAVAPEISTGENKITSNVSIIYEIR